MEGSFLDKVRSQCSISQLYSAGEHGTHSTTYRSYFANHLLNNPTACPPYMPLVARLLMQVKIAKVLAQREQAQRKRNLTKYIPNAASAIFTVLEKMAGTAARGPKRRRLQEQQQQQTGQ